MTKNGLNTTDDTIIINAYRVDTGEWAYSGYLKEAGYRFNFNPERLKDILFNQDPGYDVLFILKDGTQYIFKEIFW